MATGADVVVLNEVDRGWLLEGGHDLLRLLSEATGMEGTFAPAADDVWGNAILSRLPLRDVRTVALPSGGAAMRRSIVSAVVDTGGGDLAVVGTHLHHVEDGRGVRATQARVAGRRGGAAPQPGAARRAPRRPQRRRSRRPSSSRCAFLEDAVPGR